MTPEQAIRDAAEGRCERTAIPGQWRVYVEDGCVMFENVKLGCKPVVVCTVIEEVE